MLLGSVLAGLAYCLPNVDLSANTVPPTSATRSHLQPSTLFAMLSHLTERIATIHEYHTRVKQYSTDILAYRSTIVGVQIANWLFSALARGGTIRKKRFSISEESTISDSKLSRQFIGTGNTQGMVNWAFNDLQDKKRPLVQTSG